MLRFINIVTVIITLVSCQGDTEESTSGDTPAAGTIALGNLSEQASVNLVESPPLRLELDSQAVTNGTLTTAPGTLAIPSGSSQSLNLLESNLSVGGCMAWAVRKDSKNFTSDLQYAKCLVEKAGKDKALTNLDGLYKLKIWGKSVPTRIQESQDTAGGVVINMCLPDDSSSDIPTSETLRITILPSKEQHDSGYTISGVRTTSAPNDIRAISSQIDTTVEKIISYNFIQHITLETNESLCNGASGTEIGATDNTCFRRLEGSFSNDFTGSSTVSTMNGLFSEKNNAGARTTASVLSKFIDGVGVSMYAAGLPDIDEAYDNWTSIENWTPLDFKQSTNSTDFDSEVETSTLTTRTTSVPQIDNPWDCNVGDSSLTVDLSILPSIGICSEESLTPPDITNCTGGTAELTEVVKTYRCDSSDPLTTNEDFSCE